MIDLIDKKLLFELNLNCRKSNTEIGRKLRISKQVVNYRINQLEAKEIIRSYHALIDWRKLGFNAIRIYIKWQNISPEKEKEIYEKIRKDSFFMWTVKLQGEIDLAVYTWADSIPEFADKWFSFLGEYGEYIAKQEIYESVRMVHYPMKPLSEIKIVSEKIIGDGKKENYDNKDNSILIELTKNARVPIINISSKIGLTPKTIISRIKKLEKSGIILGYNALIDVDKLGYKFYKVDFYLNNLSKIDNMNEFAKLDKNIVYRMRTIGGPDFEIEAMVKSSTELKELIMKIRKTFPDTIKNYRILEFEKTIKQVYLPGQELNS